MRRIYVRLSPSQAEQVRRIAEDQRRHPSDQAAILIEHALATMPDPKRRESEVRDAVANPLALPPAVQRGRGYGRACLHPQMKRPPGTARSPAVRAKKAQSMNHLPSDHRHDTTVATAPGRIRRLIDGVMHEDREWFARHPGERFRYRPYVPGELYPYRDSTSNMVEVEELTPGVRVRRPYAVLVCDEEGTRGGT
jgi:hypothetical protein